MQEQDTDKVEMDMGCMVAIKCPLRTPNFFCARV